jgi:hypothetical protein
VCYADTHHPHAPMCQAHSSPFAILCIRHIWWVSSGGCEVGRWLVVPRAGVQIDECTHQPYSSGAAPHAPLQLAPGRASGQWDLAGRPARSPCSPPRTVPSSLPCPHAIAAVRATAGRGRRRRRSEESAQANAPATPASTHHRHVRFSRRSLRAHAQPPRRVPPLIASSRGPRPRERRRRAHRLVEAPATYQSHAESYARTPVQGITGSAGAYEAPHM